MISTITDFHTHAFPDTLADRAMSALLAGTGDVTAHLDGRLGSLLASMDRAGIGRAVICSIATKATQFDPIMAWSAAIRSPRIVPLPSIHPRDPQAIERIRRTKREGFQGIKLHPYYQDYVVDEEALMPFYATVAEEGLILVSHTGFDVAFPRIRRADPKRIRAVMDRFPNLRFVATHLGAWSDWDEVETHLIGRDLYMEISYSLDYLPVERARQLILAHPAERILFGSDSPWQDQSAALDRLRALRLDDTRMELILSRNAARLLDPAPD